MSENGQQPEPQPRAKPLVGEADKRWIEGMRYAGRQRRRKLCFEANDPARNVLKYEMLMEMVLDLHGRLNQGRKLKDVTEIRLANALAGRKLDPTSLPGL